ncbi:M3 family metallopeptidase [Niabella beijingensis]|uniref:M3 family metallopeptidase n=1 Tax=Niabella beijingensis TaxID=2872700 RepID=UPI001CBE24FD|nr:M3 family metallopeptidase [Niabella beijingensis]MBZ4189400.1 hypothetical protein [Niabella beijingensis]
MFEKDSVLTLNRLSKWLDQRERLLVSLQKHYQYHILCNYINAKDSFAKAGINDLGEIIGTLNNQLTRIAQQFSSNKLTYDQLKKNGLLKYRYLIEKELKNTAHLRPAHDEAIIRELSGNTVDRLVDRYDTLMGSIRADDILVNNNKYLNPIKDRGILMKDTSAFIRAAANKAYYFAYEPYMLLLGATLIDITQQHTAQAKINGFKNHPEKIYAQRLELSDDSVKQLLTGIFSYANILKDYKKLVQSPPINSQAKFDWKPLSFTKTKTLLISALTPLGKEYCRQFAWLIEPANGALEIGPGLNRVRDNTSVGYPQVPVSLYMRSYNGSLTALQILIHEGGHALHTLLKGNQLSVPAYSYGPNFLSEAYAMLNELLLLDYLQQQAPSIESKAFFAKQFLDKLAFEIFTSAQEGTFEQGLYEGVADGTITNSKDIDSLYSSIMIQYDSSFNYEPNRSIEWIQKRLVFYDPLYNVTYLYAMLVSCKLFTMLQADPDKTAIRYISMLKNGFDAPAETLLKQFMRFGLDKESLLNSAFQVMRNKSAELKKMYTDMHCSNNLK